MAVTQESLDEIFRALRQVYKAHWRVPRLADVQAEIKRTGAFVFRIGSNPWVSEVIITPASVTYRVNDALPPRMRTHAEGFKNAFDALVPSQ